MRHGQSDCHAYYVADPADASPDDAQTNHATANHATANATADISYPETDRSYPETDRSHPETDVSYPETDRSHAPPNRPADARRLLHRRALHHVLDRLVRRARRVLPPARHLSPRRVLAVLRRRPIISPGTH